MRLFSTSSIHWRLLTQKIWFVFWNSYLSIDGFHLALRSLVKYQDLLCRTPLHNNCQYNCVYIVSNTSSARILQARCTNITFMTECRFCSQKNHKYNRFVKIKIFGLMESDWLLNLYIYTNLRTQSPFYILMSCFVGDIWCFYVSKGIKPVPFCAWIINTSSRSQIGKCSFWANVQYEPIFLFEDQYTRNRLLYITRFILQNNEDERIFNKLIKKEISPLNLSWRPKSFAIPSHRKEELPLMLKVQYTSE